MEDIANQSLTFYNNLSDNDKILVNSLISERLDEAKEEMYEEIMDDAIQNQNIIDIDDHIEEINSLYEEIERLKAEIERLTNIIPPLHPEEELMLIM
jgi:predicted  nucleic acid-binding Zn-ribbon protein